MNKILSLVLPLTLIALIAIPGISAAATTAIPASAIKTITLADDGRTITLQINETFLLKLGENYDWNVIVDNQTVLSRVPNVLVVRGAQGIYKAYVPGNAILTASGDPICRKEQPPCGVPSRLFKLFVVVTAGPTATTVTPISTPKSIPEFSSLAFFSAAIIAIMLLIYKKRKM